MARVLPISREQEVKIAALWSTPASRVEICQQVGCTTDQLISVKNRLNLPSRQGQGRKGRSVDPTPAEIAILCQGIQATWSPEETAMRAGYCHLDERPNLGKIALSEAFDPEPSGWAMKIL